MFICILVCVCVCFSVYVFLCVFVAVSVCMLSTPLVTYTDHPLGRLYTLTVGQPDPSFDNNNRHLTDRGVNGYLGMKFLALHMSNTNVSCIPHCRISHRSWLCYYSKVIF